ncbi:MAG: GCN5-related N-acetyltransferase [Pseudonocardiales bacterium]|nr:GCN5-related N-acetyltransferase [Pseudonocardiales bacterium]
MVGEVIDAIRSDGGLVRIRWVTPYDRDGLIALNAGLSEQSIYRRFFTVSRHVADAFVEKMIRQYDPRHGNLVALIGNRIVAAASFECADNATAEIGLVVADDVQHDGIGTLMIEHLASAARHRGVQDFTAEVLAENAPVIRLLRSLGFGVTSHFDQEIVRLSLDLRSTTRLLQLVEDRDRNSEVASMRPLFSPRSVAIVGSTKPGSVGGAVLSHLVASGYAGELGIVDRAAGYSTDRPHTARVVDLHFVPDLAVVCVPASSLSTTLTECGEAGVRAIVAMGTGEAAEDNPGEQDLRRLCERARGYGMRFVGPHSLGVVNTDSEVNLNALAVEPCIKSGSLGVIAQTRSSGVLSAASRRAVGVSQFISLGDAAEVSCAEIVNTWECDRRISVVALVLDTWPTGASFHRILTRFSQTKPVVAVIASHPVGHASRLGGAALSEVAPTASSLMPAGVLVVSDILQAMDVASVLAGGLLPGGPRLAIISDSVELASRAVEAAAQAGLIANDLASRTVGAQYQSIPGGVREADPLHLAASTPSSSDLESALPILLKADEVDSVLVILARDSPSDRVELAEVVARCAKYSGKPVVLVDEAPPVFRNPRSENASSLPRFASPEEAVSAMGAAYRYTQLRAAAHDDKAQRAGPIVIAGHDPAARQLQP